MMPAARAGDVLKPRDLSPVTWNKATAHPSVEIVRGGRYDDIGRVFGRARPAVGFSTDLKTLMDLSRRDFGSRERGSILAPAGSRLAFSCAFSSRA